MILALSTPAIICRPAFYKLPPPLRFFAVSSPCYPTLNCVSASCWSKTIGGKGEAIIKYREWNGEILYSLSLFVSRFIEFRGRRIRYYDGIIEFRILPLKNIFRAMIINTQWKYRKNILFVWTNSKRISDTLLELIKIYQILVFHILSSRNRRRSRIKRISYIYIYIEESRSNSSDFCQASLKREARERAGHRLSPAERVEGGRNKREERRRGTRHWARVFIQ